MVSTTISIENKAPSTSDPNRLSAATNFAASHSSSNISGINSSVVQKFDSASSLNEKISILFPKCRPKSDINLNPVIKNTTITMTTTSPETSSLSSESSSATKSPNIASSTTNPFLTRQPVSTLNDTASISYYYKEDLNYPSLSQIGGSALAAAHSQLLLSHKQTSYYNSNPFVKDTQLDTHKRTPNTTPVSTVLNSPDLTDSDKRNCYQKSGHHIRVGRSPVNQNNASASSGLSDLVSPTKNITLDGGDVVVFDDIGDSWQNLRITTETPKSDSKTHLNDILADKSKHLIDNDMLNKDYDDSYDDQDNESGAENLSGIMEYDGSPRRFGQGQNNMAQYQYSENAQNSILLSSLLRSSPRPSYLQKIPLSSSTSPYELINQQKEQHQHFSGNEHDHEEELSTKTESQAESLPPAEKSQPNSTFDYLYEFSETRKVLEEFFKCPANDEKILENGSDADSVDIPYELKYSPNKEFEKYIGQRLANSPLEEYSSNIPSPKHNGFINQGCDMLESKDVDYFLDSASRSSCEAIDNDEKQADRTDSRCFRYSPDTTDYDSNYGDLDSLSGDYNGVNSYSTNYSKYYASMPILEDGLSSGHASDTENNNPSDISVVLDLRKPDLDLAKSTTSTNEPKYHLETFKDSLMRMQQQQESVNSKNDEDEEEHLTEIEDLNPKQSPKNKIFKNIDSELDSLYSINLVQLTPPPPAPAPHRNSSVSYSSTEVQAAINDIKSTLQKTKALTIAEEKKFNSDRRASPSLCSPVWIPRQYDHFNEPLETDAALKNCSGDEEDLDTDLETDRLLGHQRLEDHGYYEEKSWCDRKPRSLLSSTVTKFSPKIQPTLNSASLVHPGLNSILPTTPEIKDPQQNVSINQLHADNEVSQQQQQQFSNSTAPDKSPQQINLTNNKEEPTITASPSESNKHEECKEPDKKKKNKNKEVLIEGVLFRARYLGSTQLVCEGQPTKSTRMVQAEEAVSRIKALAPDGEVQPSTDVDLFISTEKIMVLNTDLKEIMMDHALRTISYIADIGDLVVLMARKRFVPNEIDDTPKPNRTPKMICHVFESDEAQFIAQSIGQAFQVAYMEFLKANGIEDHSFVKEMDYQEVLNSQEIFGDELEIFAKKELQKEVVVPKAKGEILGVVIVESGWGSMLPTVVIANLLSSGAAARCGQLNIGDQIIAINGLSLVGLPLSTCQTYIKNTKNQTVVKFTVVPCPPVVEVKIKRPNTKYQLGFSVQNGVICSLLRGGIAERGGVRVGHRIIEINNQSVVAVPHEKIVNLLATSVGEILMKTMPTSMFRLLTGQENPVFI